MSHEYLLLKWGTLKGWNIVGNDAAIEAYKRFNEAGQTWSAAEQPMTDRHKQAVCDMIDAINGPIKNDWTGEEMTKEAAKAYVMEYSR